MSGCDAVYRSISLAVILNRLVCGCTLWGCGWYHQFRCPCFGVTVCVMEIYVILAVFWVRHILFSLFSRIIDRFMTLALLTHIMLSLEHDIQFPLSLFHFLRSIGLLLAFLHPSNFERSNYYDVYLSWPLSRFGLSCDVPNATIGAESEQNAQKSRNKLSFQILSLFNSTPVEILRRHPKFVQKL